MWALFSTWFATKTLRHFVACLVSMHVFIWICMPILHTKCNFNLRFQTRIFRGILSDTWDIQYAHTWPMAQAYHGLKIECKTLKSKLKYCATTQHPHSRTKYLLNSVCTNKEFNSTDDFCQATFPKWEHSKFPHIHAIMIWRNSCKKDFRPSTYNNPPLS